ncbi:MAG: response regulator [Deltaproteobacteria bacterium]|nr:response regulator [Deltaproteobacteria bacterium]
MRAAKVLRRRVLLVSQDKRLKRQVQDCLTMSGFPATLIMSFDNEHPGIPDGKKTLPHVIVLDDSVTVQQGPTLLDTFHRYAPHAFVIYIAGQHTPELERTVRQLGVLYYTAKPPDDLSLQQVLTAALQRSTQGEKSAA